MYKRDTKFEGSDVIPDIINKILMYHGYFKYSKAWNIIEKQQNIAIFQLYRIAIMYISWNKSHTSSFFCAHG